MGLAEAAEKEPGKHRAHAVARDAPPAPPAARYPAGHATHRVLSEEENVPAGHAAHDREPAREVAAPGAHTAHALIDTAPLSALAVPGGHMMQEEEVCPVALLYVPAGQELQLARAVAPLVLRKRPAGQGLHEEEPGAEAKAPKPHGAQKVDPAAALKDPGAQGAQAIDALPLTPVAAEPIGQGVQVLAPSEENSPAPHALQTIEPASGAAKPLPQSAQAEASTAPGAPEAVPGGQERHPEEVCPKALLYVPAAHKVQLLCEVAPLPLKKRPTGQGLHADAPGALEK